MNLEPEVLIIGAGPAGLSAAREMARRGVHDVVVVEREVEAGGIPRFCPHATFGLAEFWRPLSGPAYAAKLRAMVDPRSIRIATTVTRLSPDLETTISSERGEAVLKPKRVLLATGIRETPRAARLVSGERPRNILTTGALQRIRAEGHALPFRRPVIVGTELVSFSALLSLREAGAPPVAMIEEQSRVTARRPADLFARWAMRTPIFFDAALVRINAAANDAARLVSITLARPDGSQRIVACDAVVFTGRFTPEASLLGAHGDLTDLGTRGPAIDQRWRTALPGLYAAGNLLRPVETAGWCAMEGRAAAASIAADIATPPAKDSRRIAIAAKGGIAFATPSRIAVEDAASGPLRLGVRMTRASRGRFVLSADGNDVWRSTRMSVLPERRILLSPVLPDLAEIGEVQLRFETGET
jgi:NADPH-dependent 2,4-dienoyl-CoA reductase/sulfur reductase-like enzyme